MSKQGKRPTPHRGNVTPKDISDTSKHQQEQIFEKENRPSRHAPGVDEKAEERFRKGEDMLAKGERTLGEGAGPDSSGAVAKPAEQNRPGASTKLGGTPGAPATRSRGRQTD